MSPVRRAVRLAGLPPLVVLACGTGQVPLGEVGTYGGDGGGAFSPGQGADAGGFSVSLTPPAPAVCPGQCADLSASASGGEPPYAYAWAGTTGGATAHVCPTATTTYSVTASDSSRQGGEFASAGHEASATATVTVSPTVSLSCDGGGPVTQAQEVCSHTWAAVPGSWGPYVFTGNDAVAAVATDAQGAIVIAYSEIENQHGVGVVEKFDAQCNEVWRKEYDPQVPAGFVQANVVPTSIAADASSNLVVAGVFSGSVDFGNGPVMSANFGLGSQTFDDYAGTAFVFELDPQGNTSWSKSLPATEAGTYASQAVFDAAGNVDLAAGGPPGMDFGGGPIAADAPAGLSYLAQFGPDGTYHFARPLANVGYTGVAAATSGSVWLSGTASGSAAVDWGGGSTTVADETTVLGELTGTGGYLASATIAPQVSEDVPWSNVRVNAAGDIFVLTVYDEDADGGVSGLGQPAFSRTLTKLASGSTIAWSDGTTIVHEADAAATWFALDGASNVFVGGDFQSALSFGGATATSAGDFDVYVRGFDAAGHPRSLGRWGGSDADRIAAITADPQEHVVVLGTQSPAGSVNPTSMFIAKLAP